MPDNHADDLHEGKWFVRDSEVKEVVRDVSEVAVSSKETVEVLTVGDVVFALIPAQGIESAEPFFSSFVGLSKAQAIDEAAFYCFLDCLFDSPSSDSRFFDEFTVCDGRFWILRIAVLVAPAKCLPNEIGNKSKATTGRTWKHYVEELVRRICCA